MANEAKVSVSLTFAKGTLESVGYTKNQLGVNVSGNTFVLRTQRLSTARAAINLGDISVPGYVVMKNLAALGSGIEIFIYPDNSGGSVPGMKPGEVAAFRFSTLTPYANASSGTPDLEYFLIPD